MGCTATLNAVDRFFSMFPQAATSFGLILLRISVAITPHLDSSGQFVLAQPTWALVALSVCSAALAVGFLTPLFAGVVAILSLTLVGGGAESFWPIGAATAAIALALLGPGAYSLDARLFGPRTIVMTMHREPEDGQ